MRECQLCGTKSWGPLAARGRALLLNGMPPESVEVDFTAYRQCDNCSSPALTAIIEKPAPDAEFSDLPHMGFAEVIGMRPPGPDPISEAMKVLEAALGNRSERETRLERIALALVRRPISIGHSFEDWPQVIMKLARGLEREMEGGKRFSFLDTDALSLESEHHPDGLDDLVVYLDRGSKRYELIRTLRTGSGEGVIGHTITALGMREVVGED